MPFGIALTCFIGVWSVKDTSYDEKGKRIDVLGPEMAFLGSAEFMVMVLGIFGMRNYGKYDFDRATNPSEFGGYEVEEGTYK